jgi:hypothetical protein
MNSFDVWIFAIRHRPGRRVFEVRWLVAGRDKSRCLMTRALADSYRAELVRAARKGPWRGLREPRNGLGLCGDAPYPKHDDGGWRDLAWPCGSRRSSPTIGCHVSEPDEP